MKIDDAVAGYVKLRDHLKQRKEAFEIEKAEIEAQMAQFEGWFLANLNAIGATSMATSNGTIYKSEQAHVNVKDWDAALAFIREKNLWPFLTKRVSKDAILQYHAETGVLLPGVDVRRSFEVNVRRA